MTATMTTYDIQTGRPLHEGTDAVERLSDRELEAEVTIALLALDHRRQRYERLSNEILKRQRELVANSK
jgi:hypothetical protein